MIRHAMKLASSAVVWALLAASAHGASVAADDAQLARQGAYLARVGDCVACHTAKDGEPFAGGLPIETPIGKVYSTNITPDKTTGIGSYSLEDFDRALRHGISKAGYSLYPAMPYPSYVSVKEDDVKALYAYFMRGVPPVNRSNRQPDIPWPLSARWPLAAWRWLFAPSVVEVTNAPDGDTVARGRYLVQGLAHCGACHTGRGMGYQEEALGDESTAFLSGSVINHYFAKDLRADPVDGLGMWSTQDIVQFLKAGRTHRAAAFGGMADVVEHSTQYLDDADLEAIAAYLKTLRPLDSKETALAYDDTTAKALRTGTDKSGGAMLFLDNCAACHRSTGQGYSETFPPLAQSSVINTEDPTSLIHLVLSGGAMPATHGAPTRFAMPGFAERLSDQEVATVLTYVRSSWGNRGSAVSASEVAKVRRAIGAATVVQR
ncbi:MAG TPA: cytochrome c [Trinickia sp.]|jgi:mono/diheme cytochrome c family protein|uniref:cytochrome c n=1 Tax=Trinickia sp. TaxID=2571163 RepID=UPI002B988CEA|nr:cytochrome c [Trinickia sp.]HTI19210.1 cytochrome c [Trinickia sp.]